jgi:competence protein ComEC
MKNRGRSDAKQPDLLPTMLPTYTFFAVGKAHMTLVQFSNGLNMLVDCRRSLEWPSPLEYLRSRIQTLDTVVITHPHQDHLTGLKEVCDWFKPRALWHNGRYCKPDPVYEDWSFYERLRNGNVSYCTPVRVQHGHNLAVGDTTVYVAGPSLPHLQDTPEDENNNSIILAVTTGKSKVILTGDSEKEQWAVTDLRPLANAAVFLASHHGREDGFFEPVLRMIRPQRIVISCGAPCDTDAIIKYGRFAPVSLTRSKNVVVRPSEVAAAV